MDTQPLFRVSIEIFGFFPPPYGGRATGFGKTFAIYHLGLHHCSVKPPSVDHITMQELQTRKRRVTVELGTDLHRDLRIKAHDEGETISSVIVKLLRNYLRESS